jgi:hypothetical protein
MKKRNHRPRGQSEPQSITRAVTHIRLEAMNAGKLTALDRLAQVYLPLCQQYIDLFSTGESPDKFHPTCFSSPLSERWHRVAIQQAAGIARSFRTNRAQAYQDYVDDLLDFHEQQAEGILDKRSKNQRGASGTSRRSRTPASRPTPTSPCSNPRRTRPLTTGSRSARWPSANHCLSR